MIIMLKFRANKIFNTIWMHVSFEGCVLRISIKIHGFHACAVVTSHTCKYSVNRVLQEMIFVRESMFLVTWRDVLAKLFRGSTVCFDVHFIISNILHFSCSF